jgi:LysR family transcriptional regulator, transcriptional activator of nhaA
MSSTLNYHHLRLFLEVAQAGSLRAAAEKLSLSQPTISAQLKLLEDALDQPLFDRSGRTLRLTHAGEQARDRAAEIFSLGEDLIQSLHGDKISRSQRLRLGITDSLPKVLAWRLIRPALQAHPELHLSCTEAHADELLGLLAAGRLDAVISDEAAPQSLPIKAHSSLLGHSALVFCAVPELAAKISRGFPQSLTDAPMLLTASRTAWRQEIEHWLQLHELRPKIVAEFDDAAFLSTAAADGLGCAPIASAALPEVVSRYGLVPIGKPVSCQLPTYLITIPQEQRPPVLDLIMKSGKSIFTK